LQTSALEGNDDAMEFEKRIDDQIIKSQNNSLKRESRRTTTRKPEDVKFRTLDEERAS
jgi:hypothetical protein